MLIKYLFKYLNKGADRALAAIPNEAPNATPYVRDVLSAGRKTIIQVQQMDFDRNRVINIIFSTPFFFVQFTYQLSCFSSFFFHVHSHSLTCFTVIIFPSIHIIREPYAKHQVLIWSCGRCCSTFTLAHLLRNTCIYFFNDSSCIILDHTRVSGKKNSQLSSSNNVQVKFFISAHVFSVRLYTFNSFFVQPQLFLKKWLAYCLNKRIKLSIGKIESGLMH